MDRLDPPTSGIHVDRRRFLARSTAGALLLTAGPAVVPAGGWLAAAGAQAGRDPQLAAFAESVELVAVAAYEAGIAFLSEDLAPLLQTLSAHHAEHAEAWAEIAGDLATGQPNELLIAALTEAIDGFSGQSEVLRFARDLENQLSVTCGHLLTQLEDADAATTAATILPVESSHAAALSFELGEGLEAGFPFGAVESSDLAFGFDPSIFPVTST